MLRARKKNRVVRIPNEKAKEYEKLGYSITDENGNTIYEPEDKDATIAVLRRENEKLKQQLAEKELLLSKKAAELEIAQEPKEKSAEKATDTGKSKSKNKGSADNKK